MDIPAGRRASCRPGWAFALALLVLWGCASPPPTPEEQARALHLVRRAAFAPTAALLQQVLDRGPERWVRDQVGRPDATDPTLEARVAGLPFTGRDTLEFYKVLYSEATAVPVDQICGPGANVNIDRDRFKPLLGRDRLLRAAFEPDPLREVLTVFWFNHFNVDFDKNEVVAYGVHEYERRLIGPRVLGPFRELLGAVAHSPVMLIYLDNTESRANVPGGLNENYGRELLELHTVGIDAGYSQQDVRDASRCFTGWTLHDDRGIGIDGNQATTLWSFRFDPARHDRGRKYLMGTSIPPKGGERDGEAVLDLLAAHPSTARFLSLKLARRFVSDDPPPALVDRLARVYLDSGGDLAKVTEALLTSEEMADPRYRLAKLRTPLEFLAAALAVLEVDPRLLDNLGRTPEQEVDFLAEGEEEPAGEDEEDDGPTGRIVDTLMALYRPYNWAAPTGWPDTAATWSSTANVQGRLVAATTLARYARPLSGSPEQMVEEAVQRVLLGDCSSRTREALAEAARSPGSERQRSVEVLTTALMSPEFQYR